MSPRRSTPRWTTLVLTALVAGACSDTPRTDDRVRSVATQPAARSTQTSPDRPVRRPEAHLRSVSTPREGTMRPTAARKSKTEKQERKTEDVAADAKPVSVVDAETAYHERRYGEAAVLFGRYVERHPDGPWGHFMHGLSCWKDGDLAKAESSFGRVLSIAPDHLKGLQNLSRVLIEQGRVDEASDLLRVAVDVDRTSNVTYRLLGRVFYLQGHGDEAVDAYWQAIILDDEDGWAMNNMALILIEHGRHDDAVSALARAVTLGDDVASFHNNLGTALERVGYFSSAAAAYRSALRADPGYERATRNLARVEEVREGPTSAPFDLDVVAQQFADALRACNTGIVVDP